MKKYKVFLASSGELAIERKEIALIISRLNDTWVEKGLYLELVVWEELFHSFRGERIQNYFNEEMLKCDIVVVLFFKKVGQFTEEEFKLAYDNLKEGKKPHFLFVYFKSGQVAIEDIDEDLLKISKLKKEIQNYEQLYGAFNSIEDLTLKLQRQLEQVILHKQKEIANEEEEANEEKARYDLENYMQHVVQKFKYLNFMGIKSSLGKPLLLENLYVALRTVEAHSYAIGVTKKRSIKNKKTKTRENGKDFATFFKILHKQKQREDSPLRILILGRPGSGKSTLMKWIALQCLKNERHFFAGFTPVFISLRDLCTEPGQIFRKEGIKRLACELLKREDILIDSFLDSHYESNRLLFLLDGLDEIGDEKVRRDVLHWIQNLYIGNNSLIFTSRFSGLSEAQRLKFRSDIPILVIQDLELNDVDAFLRNWYKNIEITITDDWDKLETIRGKRENDEDLFAIIKNKRYQNLRKLAVNPLLLTIIAILHHSHSELPRERHKLYEGCLKVMINLNLPEDGSFSFEKSMAIFSKIAAVMMLVNCKEMDKTKIERLLSPDIKEQARKFFLSEIGVKTGLLYDSEGKYGFVHFTFQEYLTAYFFVSKDQNSIIKCRTNSSWAETFKLLVNMGNTDAFFEEIIENLLEKEYWINMKLWEDCLAEVAVEETKKKIELKFAKKVIGILLETEYEEKNEKLVEELSFHYPLFEHAEYLADNARDLFHKAKHPFIQSIGASILYRAGKRTQRELMSELKVRLNEFKKQTDKNRDVLLHFLLRNNNNFLLHIGGRKKFSDFYFVLSMLKSVDLFLPYLAIRNLRDIRFVRILRALVDFRLLMDFLGLRFFQDIRLLRDLFDMQELRLLLELFDELELNSLLERLELGTRLDVRTFADIVELRDLRFFVSPQYFPVILDEYTKSYELILEKHQDEISQWTERAFEKLYNMSNGKLKKYFPKTSDAELKKFRDSYTQSIANEISKGNCDILKGKKMTKESRAKVGKMVSFDSDTVERMLDFELDSSLVNNTHSHHLKAFEILENSDYAKLREIINRFKETYDNKQIRDNALHIFKNMSSKKDIGFDK